MPIPAREAVRHYEQRQQQALDAIGSYEQLRARCEAASRRCDQQLAEISLELARAYLPGLTPEELKRV